MIHKVFPSLNDFENLSLLRVESSDFANKFDYSNVIVNKPWGYEYLWYQNETVAIWFLYIKYQQNTSLHCHSRKRTSLIVLDGLIQCCTLDDKYVLNHLQGIVLEPCVFHTSSAISENGAFLLEIETPPMKGDLVRMNDNYGRQHSGYEKQNEYSREFHLYDFYPFHHHYLLGSWSFKQVQIVMSNSFQNIDKNCQLIVPISNHIFKLDNEIIDIGEAFAIDNLYLNNDLVDNLGNFLLFYSLKK